WVLARGDDVIPIPGTTRIDRLEENIGALDLELSAAELAALDAVAEAVSGPRYADMSWSTDRSCDRCQSKHWSLTAAAAIAGRCGSRRSPPPGWKCPNATARSAARPGTCTSSSGQSISSSS